MTSAKDRVRALLPASVAAGLKSARLRASLQCERFGRMQRSTNSLISVPGVPHVPRRPGSVWGICLARNEADIIARTVQHMLDQGLDGVIIVDNLSTDPTKQILDELAAADPRVYVGTDRQVGFSQGGKTSYLAHLAWRAGADWVVPFDADEFWFAEGETVAAFLRTQRADMVWCDFRNVYPTAAAGRIDLGAGGAVQVEREESAWLRICFRARRWVWVGEGNHALRDTDRLPVRGLHMLHYSYRSLNQYSRKVDQGVAALEAAGKDDSIATHWRYWSSLPMDERAELWRIYLSGDDVLRMGPIPPKDRIEVADPTVWPTWDPDSVLN